MQKYIAAAGLGISIAGCGSGSVPAGVFPSSIARTASPVVYSFPKRVNNGLASPAGPLFAGPGGSLFGTTETFYATGCGYCGPGGVFSAVPSPSGAPTVTTIWLFDGFDGLDPQTGVVRGPDGSLYGTTISGGYGFAACESESDGCGVLFKLAKNGSRWSEALLHIFNAASGYRNDGIAPGGPPLLIDGTLYGISQSGGAYPHYYGTIFKESTNGTGYAIIYRFNRSVSAPVGTLIAGPNGTLYGETIGGGSTECRSGAQPGCGTVYSIKRDGSALKVLYAFKGVRHGDGAQPSGYLTLVDGNLFGATEEGGKKGCGRSGCGIVFELRKNASKGYSESVLYKFDADPNGSAPLPWGMALDAGSGQLYGTTEAAGDCSGSFGGTNGSCGTIFRVDPSTGRYARVYQFDGPPDGALPFGTPVIAGGALWGETYGGGTDKTGTLWEWKLHV